MPTWRLGLKQSAVRQPVEVGLIRWERSYEAGLEASRASGRPVLLLFQEVPGCAGCQRFGADVLAHPGIVEAAEAEFTPVLVHNNKPGEDAEVLARFGEPAWNYQVVRFLDGKGAELIPRADRVWETGPLAARMAEALRRAGRPVPPYLDLLALQGREDLAIAALAMPCFWVGEAALGKLPGVAATEAGFVGPREVVLVSYAPGLLTLAELDKLAREAGANDALFVEEADLAAAASAGVRAETLRLPGRDAARAAGGANYRRAPAGDQKKQLQGTAASGLGLDGAQAAKMNAWVRTDRAKAWSYLRPSQLAEVKG